jgi:spore germination protein GerM
MTRRAKILTLILLGILAAGGIYLRVLARRVSVRPPDHGEEMARTRLSEEILQSAAGPSQTATLYFPNYEQGTLITETRTVTWAESDTDRIRQVLLAHIEGPRQGASSALPASAAIRAVFLTADGTAYLDLSAQTLADFKPGIASECLAVYAIVDSLAANIPAVKRVKILVEGREVDTLDGHADLSGFYVPNLQPLSRAS